MNLTSSYAIHGLNSKVTGDLQPWSETTVKEEKLLIQNCEEGNGESFLNLSKEFMAIYSY